MNKRALKKALKQSIPILCSYVFISMAYGMLMAENGYPWYVALLASVIVYTGAFQFVLVSLLAGGASLELARSGMTMVIVTHEMRFAEAVADRMVFLENGLVVEESVPAQFFHQPHTQRAQQFLASFCYDSVRDGKNMQNTKEAN